jgi:tRNA(Ile)-lysidine synthase
MSSIGTTDGSGDLDYRALQKLDLALRRRLVRAAAERVGLSLEFRHVEEVLGLDAQGSQVALPLNWKACLRKGHIRFEQAAPANEEYAYPLPIPGRVVLHEAGLVLEVLRSGTQGSDSTREQLLEVSCAQQGLVVRNWRAGDRFWASHTSTPKKIKELLQDHRITGPEKKRWPVVVSGDEVVWLRGFGVRKDLQAKGTDGVLFREVPE